MTETPERPELKSCPFCGSANVVVEYDPRDGDWYIQCQSNPRECPFLVIDSVATSREQAVEAWNRRASSLGEPVSQEAQLAEMEARKDAAYLERNQVVAALAKVVLLNGGKAGIRRTAIEGWSDEWHGCVYIDTPWGQASWHYHDSQSSLFASLPAYRGEWDGHTTEEKYARLASPSGSPASSPEAPIAAIRKAMLLLEAKLGDSDVTHHVDEYEEPLVAAFQVLLAASRSAFSGIPRTENEARCECGHVHETATLEGHTSVFHRCRDTSCVCNEFRGGAKKLERSKEWWVARAEAEGDHVIGAGASVISSASPLSEEDRALVARWKSEFITSKVASPYRSDMQALLAIIDRLSASAPSPEDKGSET